MLAEPPGPLLAESIEGYVKRLPGVSRSDDAGAQGAIVDSAGNILATIVELKGSRGYGVMSRLYVRAQTPDGQQFYGSCPLGCDYLILRKVKA